MPETSFHYGTLWFFISRSAQRGEREEGEKDQEICSLAEESLKKGTVYFIYISFICQWLLLSTDSS